MNKKKQEWNNVLDWISKRQSTTVLTSILILLFGGIVASAINWLSTSVIFLKWYMAAGFGGILVILLGLLFFRPFFNFKFKYDFLEDYEEEMAKSLFHINKRAHNLVKSEDGILAIQIFKTDKHTYDQHIEYNFNQIINQKSKKSGISKFSPKKIRVPMEFLDWVAQFEQSDADVPPIPTKGFNPHVNSMVYFWWKSFYNGLIYKNEKDKKKHDKNYKKFLKWASKVKVKRFKAVPFVSVIKSVIETTNAKNITDYLNNNNNVNDLDTYIFEMRYNGKKDQHKNRVYYTSRILFDMGLEGNYEYIVLLIADQRIVPNTQTSAVILKSLFYKVTTIN